MSVSIKGIISHESPDLDSILSIYLLRRYGRQKYPGIENAMLIFYPAGILPEDKTPEELEVEGILVVDTGGGRFDTHPVGNKADASKLDKCAAVLVAEDLGLAQRPELEHILTFARLQDVEGKSLQSKDSTDHIFSLMNIIRGFNLTSESFAATVACVSKLLDALIAAGEERCNLGKTEKPCIERNKRLRISMSKRPDCAIITLVRWPENTPRPPPEFLDLDGVLGMYLLRRYGMCKHPELAEAQVRFAMAENAETDFEACHHDTILLVDTGVADHQQDVALDTTRKADGQPNIQQRKSATALISEVLELETIPELEQFVLFGKQIYTRAQAMEDTASLDRVVSLFNILHGFNLLNGDNFGQTIRDMELTLNAILAREKDWCAAVAQYEANAKVYKTGQNGKVKIVVVEAISGAVLKVARWKDKADLTIHKNPIQCHIVLVTRRNGFLHNLKFASLARRIRTAEAIENKEKVNFENLHEIGNVHGWFLHSSEQILSKGSPKATHVAPSRIPLEVLTDLVLSHFDNGHKLPARYCPADRCTKERCAFFPLKLANCYAHRERLRESMR